MTAPQPPTAAVPGRPLRRRWTVGFVAVCLLAVLLVAAGLYFFAPRSAPPGVTMADLGGWPTCGPGSTPTVAKPGWW
jgi:hypothetical protein